MHDDNLHKKLRRSDNLITTPKKKPYSTGSVEKVPLRSCGRSCESARADLCDLTLLSNKELGVGSHPRLRRVQDPTQHNQDLSTLSTSDIPEHYNNLAHTLGGELIAKHAGAYCMVRTFYPGTYRHGRLMLPTEQLERSLTRSAFAMKELPGCVKVSSLLFVDTETTGLGGSGTVAFLVGCASVTENGFEIRQYLIPDYSDETAMLEALLEEFTPDKTLVTYNGAAFDLPLLRGRMIVNRVTRELAMADHIDLLHAARRLFRRRLRDCSLTNVERELFGFYRENDVPGHLVPSIYFEWLDSRRLDGLTGVLEHNRLDIVSLWFLAIMVAEAFESDGSTLDAADDLHSLARVYSRRKHHDKVIDLCCRRDEMSSGVAQPDVTLFQAQAFKRAGVREQAVSLWRSLSGGESREAYWANLELAMHYEHTAKDHPQALLFTQKARQICPYSKSHQDRLNHRITRLMMKIKR